MKIKNLIIVLLTSLTLVGCQSDSPQSITGNTEIDQTVESHADYPIPKNYE